jgi:hypothetical protein
MCPLIRPFLILIGVLLLSSTFIAQEFHGRTPEMSAEVKKYGNYVTDFRAAEKGEIGEEFESTEFLESVSYVAQERVLAADYTLAMYRSISPADDKAKAARIAKEQLEYCSWQFKHEAERIAGMLKFGKVPATIQLGLKLKDDMRATEIKLGQLAASL